MENSLQHLKNLAIQSHSGTSFSPERRGEVLIQEYENLLVDDIKIIEAATDEVKSTYRSRFIKFLTAWLSSKSRIVSPMISGPSNFPVRQMQKYNDWERSAADRFSNFREKALSGIQKQIQREKSPEQKDQEAWSLIQKEILSKASTIIEIDQGINTFSSRPLFVNLLTGFIKRMAKNGQVDHVVKSIQLIRELNDKNERPIITEKNSIFKLVETATAVAEIKVDLSKKEAETYRFNGGEVVVNYIEDRIQIRHDNKPSREELDALKSKGLKSFNFSPSNKAWQRKLTNNAIYDTNKLLDLHIPIIQL